MQKYIPSKPKPIAVVVSDPSGLAISLVEILLGNFCEVIIATNKIDEWGNSLIHLKENKNYQIIHTDQLTEFENANYIICVNHVVDKNKKSVERIKKEISEAITFSSKDLIKTYLVLPYKQYIQQEKDVVRFSEEMFKNHNENVGIVYVCDQLGPRILLPLHRPFSRMIKDVVDDKGINVPVNIKFFSPINTASTARQIVKGLFSFGGIGERKIIKGKQISSKSFVRLIESLDFGKTGEDIQTIKPTIFKGGAVERVDINLKKTLLETISWFKANRPVAKRGKGEVLKQKGEKQPGAEQKKKLDIKQFGLKNLGFVSLVSNNKIKVFLITCFVFLLPYLLLFISCTSLSFSFNSFKKGEIEKSKSILSFSERSIELTKGLSQVFSKIPLLGKVYSPVVNEIPIINMVSETIDSSIEILDLGLSLISKVFSQEEYDLLYYKNRLNVSLGLIYKDLSFLESEIEDGILAKYIFKSNIGKEELKDIRNNTLLLKDAVEKLDSFLGIGEPKKYLILLQDNTELRPTGGFIESVAVLELRNGNLFSLTFNDTDSIDTELKGTVSPPMSLSNSLGENDWFLRDSNWDPDFPTAAVQAEWFMDKETGESFDGVFALNYETLKAMFDENKIILKGGMELTKENFYQQIHDNEPSTEGFINEKTEQISNSSSKDMIKLGKVLVDELSKKNIQLFFHDDKLQDLVSELKWSGEVYQPVCFNNCYADYLGVVESNVGINKVNEFIERESFLEMDFREGILSKNLVVTIKNKDGSGRTYKTYLRLLVPQDSKIQEAEIHTENNVQYEKPFVEQMRGRKEAGVLVSVPAGKEVSVVFNWETLVNIDFTRQGEYRMVWRKQPGTGEDPISITLSIPQTIKPTLDQPFVLTNEGIYRYNTNLARDFASRIFW